MRKSARPLRIRRFAGTCRALVLVVILALLVSCASTASNNVTAAPTAGGSSTQITPTPTPTATSTPTATATADVATPQTVENLLFVGDSIALELYHAAVQRSAARGGPEVRFLIAPAPDYCPDWPTDLEDALADPESTAVVISVGCWLDVPSVPTSESDSGKSADDLIETLRSWLEPLAGDEFAAPTRLLVLHSIDEPGADQHLQAAKALLASVAEELGFEITEALPGTNPDGSPTTVTIDGHQYPVRNGLDATHYCPAGPLVMADALLDELGVDPKPIELSDLEELEGATDPVYETIYAVEACEPVD